MNTLKLRDKIYYRDKGVCQYCGSGVPFRERTIDHVVPRARARHGNEDHAYVHSESNLKLACRQCNSEKADMPLEAFRSLIHRRYCAYRKFTQSAVTRRLSAMIVEGEVVFAFERYHAQA